MEAVVGDIHRALAMTGRIVDAITADQWDRPSPCAGWTVRDVVNHTVGGMRIFAAELDGRVEARPHESDWLASDPVAAYTEAADADRAAWSAPDVLSRTVTISLGELPGPMAAVVHLTELVAHGCDIAVATGHEQHVDEHLAAVLLTTMNGMGGIDGFRRPGIFGAPVAVPERAPASHRLLGYLGRDLRSLQAAMIG